MKSKVQTYFPVEEIAIPDKYLIIEIPSWDAVAQPSIDQVIQHLNPGKKDLENFVLTDEMVAGLDIDGIKSINQLKSFAMTTFKTNKINNKFYQEILPFVLTFYSQTTAWVANAEEFEDYQEHYFAVLQDYANQADMTLEEYGRQQLGLADPVMKNLEERCQEDFVFKLIAQEEYQKFGLGTTEEDYEVFIQRNVLNNGADAIEIRDNFPYIKFKEQMPEMMFSQRLFDYFKDQIQIQIKKKRTIN